MKVYDYRSFPYRAVTQSIDAGHKRLSEGKYYLQITSSRYAYNKAGVLVYAYVRDTASGEHYSIGLSGRANDSAVMRLIHDVPENALVWARIELTAKGYSRFAECQIVSRRGLTTSSLAELHWDLSSRDRVGCPLRVPWLFQRGARPSPRIAVVWLSPELEIFRDDFTTPSQGWPELCVDVLKLQHHAKTVARRPFTMAPCLKFFQGAFPDFGVNIDQNLAIGVADGTLAPYPVHHMFLSPVPANGGVRKRRRERTTLFQESEVLRMVFRIFRPELVIASGIEVARALPKVLRGIAHDGFYQLPALAKVTCDRFDLSNIVHQHFERSWEAQFIAAPDLKYFGKPRIGSKALRDGYWADFAGFLQKSVERLKARTCTSYKDSSPWCEGKDSGPEFEATKQRVAC